MSADLEYQLWSVLVERYGGAAGAFWSVYVSDGVLERPERLRKAIEDERSALGSGAGYGALWDAVMARRDRREVMVAEAEGIPDGRYAVRRRGDEGDWEFYRLERVAGVVRVWQLFGFPGEFRHEPVVRRPWAVLARIRECRYDGEVGPWASARAFAREHEVCARCEAKLTLAASIERGMGEQCARHWAEGLWAR